MIGTKRRYTSAEISSVPKKKCLKTPKTSKQDQTKYLITPDDSDIDYILLSDDEEILEISSSENEEEYSATSVSSDEEEIEQKPILRKLNLENFTQYKPDKLELQLIEEADRIDQSYNFEEPELNAYKDSVYTKAKKLFGKFIRVEPNKFYDAKAANNTKYCLVGRENEFAKIHKFLADNLLKHSSSFLYVSGPPGCGKTQQLTFVLESLVAQSAKSSTMKVYKTKDYGDITITKINCMRLNNLNEIFTEFLKNFKIISETLSTYPKYLKQKTSLSPQQLFTKLIRCKQFSSNNIILLDEFDALLNNAKTNTDRKILFEFFSFTKSKELKSSLILIGIANSLNLIDKINPRLKASGLKTTTIAFLPYTVDQIVSIIKAKLSILASSSSCQDIPIISIPALQLCAKKTASNTGDLRKVFDMLYKAIETVETATKKKYMSDNGVNSLSDYYKLTFQNAPKVNISTIAKICSSSLNGISSASRLKQTNLYQCSVLISLAKLEQIRSEEILSKNIEEPSDSMDLLADRSKMILSSMVKPKKTATESAINITELYEYYKKLIKIDSLIPTILTKNEFSDILVSLHTIGLVNITNKTKHFNINTQTVLSTCGISLNDLRTFTGEKFEILKKLLRA